MSRVTTFFRHCPACGRRFELRLVGKKEVGSDMSVVNEPLGALEEDSLGAARIGMTTAGQAILETDVPMMFVDEEFQYSYKCKHCGHMWSEIREKKSESRVDGYTGD